MQINNPFESGHIKNYIALYMSVVLIMILFFIASTLFNDVQSIDKKVFQSKAIEKKSQEGLVEKKEERESLKSKLKLMDTHY